MGYSLKLGPSNLEVKIKPFADPGIVPNIEWPSEPDSAGRWLPCDRGEDGDFYDAKVTV